MLKLLQNRIVVITRKTPLELLIERHGTVAQAEFYLASRGQDMSWHRGVHERCEHGLARVLAAIPPDFRRVRVDRDELDRFLFAPDDFVVIVGQDGLVPNAAKYLDGQTTVGINPDPAHYDGVLCQHPPGAMGAILTWLGQRDSAPLHVQSRVMALAEREDGQRLLALNEVFVGHASHQSARYRLTVGEVEERHSSSGLICATGTGSTGWARSIAEQRGIAEPLPAPDEQALVWFVREPFPSVATGTSLDFGMLRTGEALTLVSEMGEGGVLFADGIESDFVDFLDGQRVTIRIAPTTLNLVVPSAPLQNMPRAWRRRQ